MNWVNTSRDENDEDWEAAAENTLQADEIDEDQQQLASDNDISNIHDLSSSEVQRNSWPMGPRAASKYVRASTSRMLTRSRSWAPGWAGHNPSRSAGIVEESQESNSSSAVRETQQQQHDAAEFRIERSNSSNSTGEIDWMF